MSQTVLTVKFNRAKYQESSLSQTWKKKTGQSTT